ncbi:hypothetical protein KUTeg_015421 [Tegillarca granosa]|uniref:Cubilin n=1 Tax=Tegillarca granosa TaxID=220873 RepID=A0ABQ9ETP5_TEGGR|nr:hypothetical protein KUTeg_015421 [Tegillarca granosa]
MHSKVANDNLKDCIDSTNQDDCTGTGMSVENYDIDLTKRPRIFRIPSNVEGRLNNLESRLNNLQPTGEVLRQLNQLQSSLDGIQNSIPSNVNSRLTQIEQSLQSLQPTGRVQELFTDLTTRLGTVENRVTAIEGQPGSDDSLVDRVTTLRRRVGQSQAQGRYVRRLNSQVTNLGQRVQQSRSQRRYKYFLIGTLGPTCADDVNECSVYAGTDLGCQNGATCTNTYGGFSCQCTTDFHGIRCTERHDDCTGASHQELCGHGTCVNADRVQPGQKYLGTYGPKYRCICDAGWTTNGNSPECNTDVDECQERQSPCSTNPPVQCINVPGTFYCGSCPAVLQQSILVLMFNGLREKIVSDESSRALHHFAGYQGNGVTCTWVGVCNINNGGCHPQATCTESPATGRTCTCRPGYIGNGIGPSGCIQQGDTSGPCASNPCRNGAACQNSGSTYRCVCNPGYTGQQCQININECASNPCQNGGTCTDLVNGYSCQCTGCGGILTGESGLLHYPSQSGSNYPHSQNYFLKKNFIIIMFRFLNFSLEPSQNCQYDFLQINDGATMASNMIGKYCGNTIPNGGHFINSTHHQLHVWFYSDGSVSREGFSISWMSARPVCGGELSGQDHGSINSPGYPGNYPHNRTCVWTVSVSPGNNILFTFATVSIEAHQNCSYDYLEVSITSPG